MAEHPWSVAYRAPSCTHVDETNLGRQQNVIRRYEATPLTSGGRFLSGAEERTLVGLVHGRRPDEEL